jgi:hypothetical protein
MAKLNKYPIITALKLCIGFILYPNGSKSKFHLMARIKWLANEAINAIKIQK